MTGVEREPGAQVAEVVRAALAVPGVAAVRIEPDETGGPALLRLELAPGADEQEVADAVDARLRDQPQVFSGTLRSPVASNGAPEPPAAAPSEPAQTAPSPVPGPRPVAVDAPEHGRLVLERVQQVTEGMTTTTTVVLLHGDDRHTGVAEGAATVGGAHRALATATARAVESAAAGRLRLDIEAADVVTMAGERTALVLVSVLTARGPERLTGAVLSGDDPGRAVVKAVLAACNRRVSLELAAG
ncbi:MAG: hypothetical protein ACLGIV_03965 [Actinomycetes bacterium]